MNHIRILSTLALLALTASAMPAGAHEHEREHRTHHADRHEPHRSKHHGLHQRWREAPPHARKRVVIREVYRAPARHHWHERQRIIRHVHGPYCGHGRAVVERRVVREPVYRDSSLGVVLYYSIWP